MTVNDLVRWLVIPCLLWPLAAGADTVTLTNGDVLTGEVLEQTEEAIRLQHPVLGEMTVPRAKVGSVVVASAEPVADEPDDGAQTQQIEQATSLLTGAGYTVQPPEAPEPPNPGLQVGSLSLFEGWDRSLSVGITGSEGNTENFNGRVGLDGSYEDVERRWGVSTAYYRATDSGETTEERFFFDVTRDWLLPEEKHFYFLTGRYDWDDFQDWESRVSGAGGVGYQFVNNDTWNVLGRAGLGGNQTYGGTDDDFTPEGLVGVAVGWTISDANSVQFANTFYPDLDGASEFRNVTSLDWKVSIDAVKNLALKLGIENEHQSDPGGDAEKNDLTYYLALVLDF